jgi:hypothetical protein
MELEVINRISKLFSRRSIFLLFKTETQPRAAAHFAPIDFAQEPLHNTELPRCLVGGLASAE